MKRSSRRTRLNRPSAVSANIRPKMNIYKITPVSKYRRDAKHPRETRKSIPTATCVTLGRTRGHAVVSYSTGLQTAFVRIRDSRIFAVSLSDKTRLPGQGYPRCQTAGRQVVWTPEEQAAVWHSLRVVLTLN